MRLTAIFVAVLAASVIVTSLAAWGITYGVSYVRVTTMASEFTRLELGVLQLFDTFVTGLLQGNAALVGDLLTLERRSGGARMQQTKGQVLQIIGSLVNYTTNATDQSQQQMNTVVDTFAGLMGTVFTDFKGVTMTCASSLRGEIALKVSNFVGSFILTRTVLMQRFQSLYDLGFITFDRGATDPVGPADCALLGLLCDSALELGIWGILTLVTAAGRHYYCVPGQGAFLTTVSVNGSRYTEYRQTWLPSTQLKYKQQCQAVQPVSVVVGRDCPLPQGCQCGADERCQLWYQPYLTDSTQRNLATEVFVGRFGTPQVAISYPIVNSSTGAPTLLAALSTDFVFSGAQIWLSAVPVPQGTMVALLCNDTYLSSFASIGRKCAANETAPGDPTLPTTSSLRYCDPSLRDMATWLSQNRPSVQAQRTVRLSTVVWDIFPYKQVSIAYFVVIGAKDEDTYREIVASDAKATRHLSSVRAEQLSQVAASGAATQAYMAAVQAANVQQVQAMQTDFLAEMEVLDATSTQQLAVSQQSSSAEVAHLMSSQTQEVDALKSRHLSAMTVASGWVVGVVFAILAIVLCFSTWGTIRVTRTLTNLIDLMEDVVHLRVEGLRVPQQCQVSEVARIQAAFQVLVLRLAEYKGYIPAGIFERTERLERQVSEFRPDNTESELSGSDNTVSPRARVLSPKPQPFPRLTVHHKDSVASSHASYGMPYAVHAVPFLKANVAVLCLNVVGFRESMSNMADTLTNAAFNHYVILTHEVVSQNRGMVDCVMGDQIFATFNAHVTCADPATASAATALEIQSQLRQKVSDRLKCQIGISFGVAFAGTVGYTKFKSMVTMGWPMKVASILSHLSNFESAEILTDARFYEKVKYSFVLRPVELIHLPKLAASTSTLPPSSCVYLLQSKKKLEEDEWLYQVEKGSPTTKWDWTFQRLVAATTPDDFEGPLLQYLAEHPGDALALRLRSRLALWAPGLGITLCDGVEHTK